MNNVGKPRLMAALLLVFPIFFIFQGLDFTDMGYVLVTSRDTLADPGNVPGFLTFLSMFINGLWMKLSAPLGLIGARAGVVLVFWTIFALSAATFKGRIPAGRLYFWIFLTFIFTFRPPSWISYNNITTVFALASLWMLYRGHTAGRRKMFIISGALCALAFFARFPNILMISFGLIPLVPPMAVSGERDWKRAFACSRSFLIGYAGSILLVLFLMHLAGYLEFFWHGFMEVHKLASNSTSHHSAKLLIRLFITDHVRVMGIAVLLLLVGTGSAFIVPILSKPFRAVFLTVCGIVFLAIGWRFYQADLITHHGLIGVLYLYLLMRSWFACYSQNGNDLVLYLCALAMLVTVPLGSNNGITNARHALWLALPLFLNDVWNLKNLGFALGWSSVFEGEESKTAFWFKRLVVAAILIVGLVGVYRYTYRDTSDRLAMRYTVDHPKLRWVFTTKERAAVVKEVLDELEKYVRPGDYMLGFNTVSTLYYLTDTRPYVYSSWPFLYEPEQLKYYLEKADRERGQAPVACRSKYSLGNFEWPVVKNINTSERYTENLKIMDEYLDRKGYEKVWENECFEILRVK